MKKVLVVDDDPSCRALICLSLEHLGFDAVQATRLDEIADHEFEACLMDGLLPDGSGVEYAKSLAMAGVPLIFVSGATDDHNLSMMWKIAPVINKPLGIHLIPQLERLLRMVMV